MLSLCCWHSLIDYGSNILRGINNKIIAINLSAHDFILLCILSWLLVLAFGQVGIDYSMAQGTGDITALIGNRLYPSIPIANIIFYGIAVVIIAALASLIPAWQASRNEPAESLHHV